MTSLPVRHKRVPRKEVNNAKAPTSTNRFNGGWVFVNSNQPDSTKDAEVRKVVRANAMRYHRRKQKQKQGLGKGDKERDSPVQSTSSSAGSGIDRDLPNEVEHLDPFLVEVDSDWSIEGSQAHKPLTTVVAQRPGCSHLPWMGNHEQYSPCELCGLDGTFSEIYATSATSPLSLIWDNDKDPFDAFPIKGRPKSSEQISYCMSYPIILLHLFPWIPPF